MKKQRETFQGLLLDFQYRHDLRSVFDDFLTMAIASFGRNPGTGLSYDEDLYLTVMHKYKKDGLGDLFPKMLACLTLEMEERLEDSLGWDVLGDFYQEHLYKKGTSQYFTPWPICKFMASATKSARDDENDVEPLRILDPACGSGRMLLAASREFGPQYYYFGIDVDLTCVKMATLTLFLSGIFRGEVMCGDALRPDDFRGSYRLSFLPFGIFRVEDPEQSVLYRLHRGAFTMNEPKPPERLPGEEGSSGSQLSFF